MKSARILGHRAMRKNVATMAVTLTGERSVCAARPVLSSCETYSPLFPSERAKSRTASRGREGIRRGITVMPISHVYTLADLPARIIFVPVLYIILTRWTPLFRVQRSVLLTTSHIHSMILRVISSSSRFLPLAPYTHPAARGVQCCSYYGLAYHPSISIPHYWGIDRAVFIIFGEPSPASREARLESLLMEFDFWFGMK